MLAKSIAFSLACAIAASAQSADVPSLTTSLAPAAETVAVNSTAAKVALFEEEAVQLTDSVVAELQANPDLAEYASLFEFEDSSNSTVNARARRVRRSQRCKTMPGDPLYPSKLVWGLFDSLLGGALEKIVPIGSPCYRKSEYNNYNAEKCDYLVKNYKAEELYYQDNGALMNPLYYGMTCPIPASGNFANGTCTQGGYSKYAVKVSNVAQVQLAINLARSLNLRLAVRNTGHDYNGRSVAKGALSIWTHNLKEIKYVKDFKDPTYSGPVFKIGAGVQGFELYQAAEKYGVSAVSGICPTVGVAGGYQAGGGHSPLMQLFGVGSDQVVALEVVKADGRFVTATPTINKDLYWAMLGGGGGTFGVVTSSIVKVHRKVPVTVSTWSIMTSETVSVDAFWEAFRFFWDSIPAYNKAKTYSYFSLMKLAPGLYSWSMGPFFATEKTVVDYEALIKPFYEKCAQLGIKLAPNTTYYDTFFQAYSATFGTFDYFVGGAGAVPGNRLIPTENWANEGVRTKTFDALKNAVENALMLNMYHQHPAEQEKKGRNSVNPAFRNEESMVVAINLALGDNAAGWKSSVDSLNTKILDPLRKITPTGGTYGNEADPAEPNWQNSFWGKNYHRLLKIKKEVDPTGLFYVHHGVGSEDWFVDDKGIVGVQSTDGPLCRVQN